MKTNNIQIRNATIQPGSVNEEERTAVFVITSEDVDTFNTVFRSSGWDFTQYRNNPVVAYNHNVHDPNPDNIIGTTEDIWKEGTLHLAKMRFEDAETNPLAEKVFRKVKNGTLRMASINAYIDEARMGKRDAGEDPEVIYFTKQRLQEWSIVSIGSNPSALKRNSESLQALRSAVAKDIETNDPETVDQNEPAAPEKRALSYNEAQLIVNQNRLVK